jgi:hypothetical protein
MVDDSLLPHIEKIQSAHHVINLQREEIDKQNTIIQTLQDKLDKVEERVEEPDNNLDFAISRLTYWMRSAYVIKIEPNTKLIFTDLEDNRVNINGLDNVTITVSWNSIKPTLKKMVDDSFLPHIENIQSAHHVLNLQREEIDKQNTIIQTLQDTGWWIRVGCKSTRVFRCGRTRV